MIFQYAFSHYLPTGAPLVVSIYNKMPLLNQWLSKQFKPLIATDYNQSEKDLIGQSRASRIQSCSSLTNFPALGNGYRLLGQVLWLVYYSIHSRADCIYHDFRSFTWELLSKINVGFRRLEQANEGFFLETNVLWMRTAQYQRLKVSRVNISPRTKLSVIWWKPEMVVYWGTKKMKSWRNKDG